MTRKWRRLRVAARLSPQLLMLLISLNASAKSLGIDSSQMVDGPATCSAPSIACHGPASNEVSVSISGPTELEVDEIASYQIEISIVINVT